jgi:hypothetical protein
MAVHFQQQGEVHVRAQGILTACVAWRIGSKYGFGRMAPTATIFRAQYWFNGNCCVPEMTMGRTTPEIKTLFNLVKAQRKSHDFSDALSGAS